jgi:hypothetical protein
LKEIPILIGPLLNETVIFLQGPSIDPLLSFTFIESQEPSTILMSFHPKQKI